MRTSRTGSSSSRWCGERGEEYGIHAYPNCTARPLPVLRRPYEDMEWWVVEKAEREIHGAGLKLKWLHEMGEPLLYARIDDAIRLFPEASLSTNGLVLTPEIGAKLLATPLKRIRICVDSIDPKIYPQLRTGGDFDKLVDLTRKFLAQAKGHPLRIEIQKMRSRLVATQLSEARFRQTDSPARERERYVDSG